MKYYTYTLKMGVLNFLAIILFSIVFTFVNIFYHPLKLTNFPLLIVLSIFYLFLHEIIHYIGFITNKDVKSKNITMGAELEKGVFYCMCKQRINKRIIIKSVFLPLFTLGIITLIIGIILKLDILIFLSTINITGSIGDIIMGLFILSLPNDIEYTDLDDCTSFTIISKEEIKDTNFIGLKLIKTGNYNNSIKAKEFNKMKISKLSYIIFLTIIILFIGLVMI